MTALKWAKHCKHCGCHFPVLHSCKRDVRGDLHHTKLKSILHPAHKTEGGQRRTSGWHPGASSVGCGRKSPLRIAESREVKYKGSLACSRWVRLTQTSISVLFLLSAPVFSFFLMFFEKGTQSSQRSSQVHVRHMRIELRHVPTQK